MSKSSRKLYYGLTPKPAGRRFASARQSLKKKQVRHYGELAVPHRILVEYKKGGSKTTKKRSTTKRRSRGSKSTRKTSTRKRRSSKK